VAEKLLDGLEIPGLVEHPLASCMTRFVHPLATGRALWDDTSAPRGTGTTSYATRERPWADRERNGLRRDASPRPDPTSSGSPVAAAGGNGLADVLPIRCCEARKRSHAGSGAPSGRSQRLGDEVPVPDAFLPTVCRAGPALAGQATALAAGP
jgi:hypothetical protein